MTAAQALFLAGLILLSVALALWPEPADAEPDQAEPGSIDYRPSVLQARLTFADVATSPRRNAAWLTDTQNAALMPCASELAARRAMQRMRVRMTGSTS